MPPHCSSSSCIIGLGDLWTHVKSLKLYQTPQIQLGLFFFPSVLPRTRNLPVEVLRTETYKSLGCRFPRSCPVPAPAPPPPQGVPVSPILCLDTQPQSQPQFMLTLSHARGVLACTLHPALCSMDGCLLANVPPCDTRGRRAGRGGTRRG